MDTRRQGKGLQTFLEHWGFWLMALVGLIASQVVLFFIRLTGALWLWGYGVGLCFAALGVALLFYAKLPLYRQRRFFTFGSAALPASRRSFYRWGYGCVILAVALLLCLLLSKP